MKMEQREFKDPDLEDGTYAAISQGIPAVITAKEARNRFSVKAFREGMALLTATLWTRNTDSDFWIQNYEKINTNSYLSHHICGNCLQQPQETNM